MQPTPADANSSHERWTRKLFHLCSSYAIVFFNQTNWTEAIFSGGRRRNRDDAEEILWMTFGFEFDRVGSVDCRTFGDTSGVKWINKQHNHIVNESHWPRKLSHTMRQKWRETERRRRKKSSKMKKLSGIFVAFFSILLYYLCGCCWWLVGSALPHTFTSISTICMLANKLQNIIFPNCCHFSWFSD